MSVDTGGDQRRQVSYYGPIYIRNSQLILPENNGYHSNNIDNIDPGTSPEDQIDITKYRIKTPTSAKKHHAPPPPKPSNNAADVTEDRGPPYFYLNRNGETLVTFQTCNDRTTFKDKPLVTSLERQPGMSPAGNTRHQNTADVEYATVTKLRRQRYMKCRRPTRGDEDTAGNSNLNSKTEAEEETAEYVPSRISKGPAGKEYEEPVSATQPVPTQVEDDTDQYEEYNVKDNCPFKISSTEDNYMLEHLRGKSDKPQERNTMSNEPEIVIEIQHQLKEMNKSQTPSNHQRSKSAPEEESKYIKETKSSTTSARDFLAKHRKRIAKLKKRFFENQPDTRPLPVDKETDDTEAKEQADETELDNTDLENSKNHDSAGGEGTGSPSSASDRLPNFHDIGQQGTLRRHSIDGCLGRSEFEAGLRRRWVTSGREFAVVIAIDFGTTYSGYAYSFVHEPDVIHLMRRQESGEPGVFDQKVPTTILLSPDGLFHSFGYAARDFYYDLDQKEAVKWMYFDRFKMMLHKEKILRTDTVLRTNSGKEVSALHVFAFSLAYFKDLALQEISDQSTLRINTDVIRWVITVPAIWKASAKQFMRQAAYEAGIVSRERPDQLLIALEPEAASIFCRRLRLFQVLSASDDSVDARDLSDDIMHRDVSRTSSWSLPELKGTEISVVSNDLQIGTRYMVVDCGGGTVDITVHEIAADKRLKELQRASGGAHGSVGVDEAFEHLLGAIVGYDLLDQFRRRRPAAWLELMAMFESRKRTASPYRASPVSVPLPYSFVDFFKKCRGASIESAVRKYGDPDITWTSNGTLRLSPTAMRRLFRPTVDRIKQAIGDVLNNPRLTDIEYMFLAGGFAESSIIQHELRKDFSPILKIIIPPAASMTVLKGSVCFGLDPSIVYSRCSCLTYGVGVLHRYDPDKHPQCKQVTKDGLDWCTDVFDAFVRVNQSVELGETILRRYTPVRRDQTATTINIYSTESADVTFITDAGVTKCGTLTLSLSDVIPLGQRREIRTEMMFGDTEIRVRAIDVNGGQSVEAYVDFINF